MLVVRRGLRPVVMAVGRRLDEIRKLLRMRPCRVLAVLRMMPRGTVMIQSFAMLQSRVQTDTEGGKGWRRPDAQDEDRDYACRCQTHVRQDVRRRIHTSTRGFVRGRVDPAC